MTARRSVDHFLRSNPRTERALATFIGDMGARRRSKRVITQSDVDDDGRMIEGGIWTPRVATEKGWVEYEEEQPPARWFGHRDRGRAHQDPGKKPRPRDSGFLEDSSVWITRHNQGNLSLDKMEEVIKAGYAGEPVPYAIKNKMAGIASINVSTDNAFCQGMREKAKDREACRKELIKQGADPDDEDLFSKICLGCYANELEGRPSVKKRFTENLHVLTEHVISQDELPVFEAGEVIRFHAFGDMVNEVHFVNMFNIVNWNPQAYFTVWSKNYRLFHDYLVRSGNAKPPNLTIIFSNNDVESITLDPVIREPMSSYVDGTFNVVKTKDIHNLVYGDIKNFERNYPGIDPATPLQFGPDATLGVDFVYCDKSCAYCKYCYEGKTGFIAIEDFRKTRGKDPFASNSKRRGAPGIEMTVMGFRRGRVGPRGPHRVGSRRQAFGPQTLPRRQVGVNRGRMPMVRRR